MAKRTYIITTAAPPPQARFLTQVPYAEVKGQQSSLPFSSKNSYCSEDDSDDHYSFQPARKRERLTHLTTEQKLSRRKMKNRIAAQTARDRKKALMSEMEKRYRILKFENESLKTENSHIKRQIKQVSEENETLKVKIDDAKIKTESSKTSDVFESAAFINDPQQKEQASIGWTVKWLMALLTIVKSQKSCETSSINTASLPDQVPWSTIWERTKLLPLNQQQRQVLNAKLTELENIWKTKRKKPSEE